MDNGLAAIYVARGKIVIATESTRFQLIVSQCSNFIRAAAKALKRANITDSSFTYSDDIIKFNGYFSNLRMDPEHSYESRIELCLCSDQSADPAIIFTADLRVEDLKQALSLNK